MVRFAWPGWWLGLLVGIGSPAAAQANLPPPRIELKENYPNPFFPATTIPFTISSEVCARGHQPVVSLKIYNVLVQMVAIPVLADGSAERLDSLRLRCGEYRAYWDGKYLDGDRRVGHTSHRERAGGGIREEFPKNTMTDTCNGKNFWPQPRAAGNGIGTPIIRVSC